MPNNSVQENARNPPPGKRRPRRWFVAGFLMVFAGMLFTVTMYPWSLKGDAVVRCKLWEYYALEFERTWNGNRAMGPTSGSSSRAIVTGVGHLACSAAGGAIATAVGWIYYRIQGRRGESTSEAGRR